MKVPKVIVPKHAMFNYDTVNIFTDASIIKYPNETIGCAGAHIVTGYDATSEILEQPRIIIRNSTNNFRKCFLSIRYYITISKN